MPLTVGTRLGHYDVTALLGEGGMGQVWQATDTQLNRQVALKILPDAFAADPDRLARFTREAQILASLNHPNIAAIYGIEEAEGTRALVLELVEGPTLADRISKGPIPLDEALPIAKQIAEALEAAHDAGVIHRDLKPANIKVREDGTVKVLDFGLAKAFDPSPDADPSQSPTLTAAATQMGVILGTAAYMSPEQARGSTVDRRADIWSFAVVLYEMLTGRNPFPGDDISQTLARVIDRDPDWDVLPKTLSPALDTYLRRCLQKDPRQRVRDIGDVRLAMEGAFETTVSPSPVVVLQPAGWRQVLPWVAGLVVAVVSSLAVWTLMRPPVALPTRLTVVPPPGVVVTGSVQLSPDGRTVAFGGRSGDGSQVYLRPLDQLEAVPLRGAEGTLPLGFSRDGQWLVVVDSNAGGRALPGATVKRVPLAGGPTTTLLQSPRAGRLGTDWGPDDNIVLGTSGGGLRLVRASGGEATPLTTLAEGEIGHYEPSWLPSGRAVLFNTWGGAEGTTQVAVYDLETDKQTNLLPGTTPKFAATGHLTFWRDGSLWAVPFDPDRLAVLGEPVIVVEGVASFGGADVAGYALGDNGTLAYQPAAGTTNSTLGWVNRQGEMTQPVSQGRGLSWPRLSPNGTLVAFSRDTQAGSQDIFITDLDSARETKLTEAGGTNAAPVWTPDGTTVTFNSDRGGGSQLYARAIDLSSQTELVGPTGGVSIAGAWTPDGQTLVYYVQAGDRDIWRLPVGGDPVPFLATESNERAPRLSPNGKWLAYISDQPGEDAVFVQAFPQGGRVFSISTGPGTEAVWSRDGRELFYRDGNQLWVVDVETEPGFTVGNSRLLFEAPYALDSFGVGIPNYDVSRDGQQLLMIQTAADETPGFTVVLNWFEELKRLVPLD